MRWRWGNKHHEPRTKGALLARKIHAELIDDISARMHRKPSRFALDGAGDEIDM
ncbi:hypothetical protein SAMN04487916_105121 [Arthrobacter sp. ov407]|nr:hypothetical protein SAMN04487916_105121 [Arthrobacter sp. ov407]